METKGPKVSIESEKMSKWWDQQKIAKNGTFKAFKRLAKVFFLFELMKTYWSLNKEIVWKNIGKKLFFFHFNFHLLSNRNFFQQTLSYNFTGILFTLLLKCKLDLAGLSGNSIRKNERCIFFYIKNLKPASLDSLLSSTFSRLKAPRGFHLAQTDTILPSQFFQLSLSFLQE